MGIPIFTFLSNYFLRRRLISSPMATVGECVRNGRTIPVELEPLLLASLRAAFSYSELVLKKRWVAFELRLSQQWKDEHEASDGWASEIMHRYLDKVYFPHLWELHDPKNSCVESRAFEIEMLLTTEYDKFSGFKKPGGAQSIGHQKIKSAQCSARTKVSDNVDAKMDLLGAGVLQDQRSHDFVAEWGRCTFLAAWKAQFGREAFMDLITISRRAGASFVHQALLLKLHSMPVFGGIVDTSGMRETVEALCIFGFPKKPSDVLPGTEETLLPLAYFSEEQWREFFGAHEDMPTEWIAAISKNQNLPPKIRELVSLAEAF